VTDETAIEGLVRQLYGLGHVRRELARHALAELGSQGFHALAAVHVHGPARVSTVAARLGVDLSVASRQVNALIKAGYVARECDDADRRASRLTLTEAGQHVLKESHRRMVHAFDRALDGWSEDEIASLAAGLERLSTDFAAAASAGSPTPQASEVPE
jgi:DNA-binding MarR family transcriptional regulator